MLKERLEECEERAFAGDSVAVQSYITDARQMITEFRQARELFPREKVRAWMQGIETQMRANTHSRASNSTLGPRPYGWIFPNFKLPP